MQVMGESQLHPRQHLRCSEYTIVGLKFVHCPVVWRKVKTVVWFSSNPEEAAASSVLHPGEDKG